MATVRIYKVAELLGLSSQDAIDLLKKETGIDVKSASSSIEEIVARQFVERQARKRQITLPHGPLFAETPVAKKPAGKGKAAEPPKPAAPVLRPRLIKTIKPAHPDGVEDQPAAEVHVEPAAEAVVVADEPEVVAVPEVIRTEPAAPVHVEPAATSVVEEPVVEAPAAEPAAPEAPAGPAIAARGPARIVPPTRRLRIEDPLTGEAPAARPVPPRPVIRPKQAPPAPTRPATPAPPRPPATGMRPPSSPSPRPPLGGPRALPAQPIRPSAPPGARPGPPQ